MCRHVPSNRAYRQFYFRGSIVPATASSTLFMIGYREPSRQYSRRRTGKALPRLRSMRIKATLCLVSRPLVPLCTLTLYPVAKNRSSTWTGRVFPRTSFGYRADEPGLLKRQGMNSNTRASLNDRLTQRQPDLSPFPTPASRAYHGSTKSMCRLHAVDPVRHFNLLHVDRAVVIQPTKGGKEYCLDCRNGSRALRSLLSCIAKSYFVPVSTMLGVKAYKVQKSMAGLKGRNSSLSLNLE